MRALRACLGVGRAEKAGQAVVVIFGDLFACEGSGRCASTGKGTGRHPYLGLLGLLGGTRKSGVCLYLCVYG